MYVPTVLCCMAAVAVLYSSGSKGLMRSNGGGWLDVACVLRDD